MSRFTKATILAFFCFLSLGLSRDTPIIEVKTAKDTVETDEIFTYKITLEGTFSKPQLKLPEFKDFIIASQSQSKNYSFRDGDINIILNLTYFLFAPEAGIFTIEPAVVEDESKIYKSKPLTVKVTGKSLPEKRKLLPFIEKGTDI